jgi:8-oxo-dGTP pyrophosphatase MutT (NUDIX family)
VLLLDPDGRILLLGYDDDLGRYWALPGGGLEPGESHAEAAVREVAEEVGIAIELGPELWTAQRAIVHSGGAFVQYERVWLARVGAEQLAVAARADLAVSHAADDIRGFRWFDARALVECPDRFTPPELPGLADAVVAADGGRPAGWPLELGLVAL